MILAPESLSELSAAQLRELLDRLMGDLRHKQAIIDKLTHENAMLKRLKDAGLSLDVSDERVLKELTLFADRADITEEVVRLKSHIAQFSTELLQPNSGRKLDFLIQELLREVNTIGSKASEIATTKLVLESKTEIERIREQVQNLE